MIVKFGLSQREINNAIKEINEYRNTLNAKCELMVQLLCDEGYKIAHSVISKHKNGTGSTLQSLRIITTSQGDIVGMRIVVESEAILFLEFGAGITYNKGVTHPLENIYGYGVGTYPGQTHAEDENGWWYIDENGQWRHSLGIGADMPMYKASVAMRESLLAIARQAFGWG